MNTKPITLFFIAAAILGAFASSAQQTPTAVNTPSYTPDGQLRFPADYRESVYVTTGFDMSYNPAMSMDHHMFDTKPSAPPTPKNPPPLRNHSLHLYAASTNTTTAALIPPPSL